MATWKQNYQKNEPHNKLKGVKQTKADLDIIKEAYNTAEEADILYRSKAKAQVSRTEE